MQGLSDKCCLESCRLYQDGRCTDREQRSQCLEMLNQIIPGPGDRMTFALSGSELFRAMTTLGHKECLPR